MKRRGDSFYRRSISPAFSLTAVLQRIAENPVENDAFRRDDRIKHDADGE